MRLFLLNSFFIINIDHDVSKIVLFLADFHKKKFDLLGVCNGLKKYVSYPS